VAVLTPDDLSRFARDGWLLVSGVVPEPLLAAADQEIDGLVASEPAHGTDGTSPGRHGWFPPVARLPRCDDVLRRSGALAIAEELVAPSTLEHRFDHIQVATTVPPYDHVPGGSHIDNHAPGDDAPASFTLLAGILLTDQVEPQTGNLHVWSGSHVGHSQLFHERGTRVLQPVYGHPTMLDPPVQPGVREEVRGRRGDLVLAHFLTGHNGGGNLGAHTRRTIYYRLATPGHPARWEEAFLDPWTEYPPVLAELSR
jgi:hypothetical protein